MNTIVRSYRRSKDRVAVVEALEDLGEADLAAIAARSGVRVSRVRDALRGNGRLYRKSFALLRIGAVEEIRGGGRNRYRLSRLGREGLRDFRTAANLPRRSHPVPAR